MKRLQIRVIGSKRMPVKLQIRRGTRSCDVLAHLKLWDFYVLARASDPTTQFQYTEDLYAKVKTKRSLSL
jgi:hypothetical protein